MCASMLKDKVPPHNLEAEQATLGALLLDWKSFRIISSRLTADNFYSIQNQKIFQAMLDLDSQSQTCDLISLKEKLKEKGELDAAGGTTYLSELSDKVATIANIDYYAKLVYDQSLRRNLIKSASGIIAASFDETKESRGILEEAQKEIFDLSTDTNTQKYKKASELITQVIEYIQSIAKNKTSLTGIESGITDLDQMTSGFQPSEMIILGARPSIGKTAMALTMMQHIAIEKKIPTAFFSLEMADTQIIQRLLVQESRIHAEKIRNGFLTTNDFHIIGSASSVIYESPLYIVDTPNMKLLDLRTMARTLKAEHDIKIIFIDYITLIGTDNPSLPRHEQVSEISRSLKSLARELKIPIVALSQVTRNVEGKQPSLADLRESGSIEQDADVVMFLHRERAAEDKNAPIETEVILAKQRNGPTGVVKVMFIPYYTKFENISTQSDNR